MSDELSPPPLRLKPRIKLDTNTPAAAPSETSLPAADTPTPSSNGVEAPRFRLRPKLDSEIAPQAHGVESAPTDSPALPARPIALKPRMSLAQPIAESLAKAEQTIPQPDVSRTTAEVDAAPPPSTPDSAPPEQQTKFKLKEKAPASAPSAPSLASPASSTPPIPAPVPSNTSKPAFSLTPPPFPVMAGPET